MSLLKPICFEKPSVGFGAVDQQNSMSRQRLDRGNQKLVGDAVWRERVFFADDEHLNSVASGVLPVCNLPQSDSTYHAFAITLGDSNDEKAIFVLNTMTAEDVCIMHCARCVGHRVCPQQSLRLLNKRFCSRPYITPHLSLRMPVANLRKTDINSAAYVIRHFKIQAVIKRKDYVPLSAAIQYYGLCECAALLL